MVVNTYLLDLYIKYNNKKEEYEKKYHKSFNDISNEIETMLENSSFLELTSLYLKYTNIYFLKNNDLSNLLELIYENILKKLETIETIDILDFLADLFHRILEVERNIEVDQNIMRVRSYNIQDDFFLELQSRRLHRTKEQLISQCKDELSIYHSNLILSKLSFKYLDELQNAIFSFLDKRISKLTAEEKDKLNQKINTRIKNYAKDIQRKHQLLKNKSIFEIEARFNAMLLSNLDFKASQHKLLVYENYQQNLMEAEMKNFI